MLLDGLWGGGLEQVHMRETIQCIMERRPNQMERRENGQKRAGELQMTQVAEDAWLEERWKDG
uniref:Uncharacterized protein n=2 Tax=Guillardia theta TaxID=55529 RepID=A0A0C3SQQ3_GUITC